jgi:hypothetical protein
VVDVDLCHSRSAELGRRLGETVYVSTRRVHGFVPDYSI